MNESRDESAKTAGRQPARRKGPWLDMLTVLAGGVVFCLLLFLLFRHLFPAALWRGEDRPQRAADSAAARELAYDGAPAQAPPSHIAMLLNVVGDVKVRYADSLSWGDAQTRLALHAEDAVQTFARSSALLRVEGRDYLELGERSLIVFSGSAPDRFADAPPARRGILLQGTVTGSLGGEHGAAVPFEIALAGGLLRLSPDDAADGEVRFQVNRNPDSSSSISLFAGRASLTTGGAEEVLEPGVGVTLDDSGRVVARRALPRAPAALTPTGGTEVAYRDVPPRVVFRWSPVDAIGRYRLRVARDPELRELLFDERVSGASFTLSDLHAGEHYWAVSALDGWHESSASTPRRLRIVQDAQPPALVLDESPESANPGRLIVRGHTEPGARVYVQGAPIEAQPSGEFETEVALRPGASLVVVEATDAVGNASYHSQIVTAREAERTSLAETETSP